MADKVPVVMPAPGERKDRANSSFFDQCADRIFVGREREMAELRAAFQDAHGGRGHLYLLAGEPGIGKTRTAEEFTTYARQHAARILLGRCYEGEGAPPFWPWVQIVRSYLSTCDSHTVRAEMGPGAMDIAQIISEVRECLPDLSAPPVVTPEAARFRFFDSFTQWLKNLAKTRPLLLILDDLHWADTPSLSLLQFVARDLQDARILVVATYRDVGLGIRHPLTLTLGELARVLGSQSISLNGLNEKEVARLIEIGTGAPPADPLAVAIHRETEGNPFFVTEVVQQLVTDGQSTTGIPFPASSTIPLPQRVRESIARRLRGLSSACVQLLSVAAVIGREFDLRVLESLRTVAKDILHSEQLLDLLDEAVSARLVAETASAPHRYSFSHALIRETLYEDLAPSRRGQLHHLVGQMLEKLHGADTAPSARRISGQTLAELAYHFSLVAHDESDAEKAFQYTCLAAEHTTAVLAYEDAAAHYGRALQTLTRLKLDEERRCELLLALGNARRQTGDIPQARETFLQAATLAKTLEPTSGAENSGRFLARAALAMDTGFAGAAMQAGMVNPVVIDLLENALRLLGEQESALRARVLGRLAMELYWSTDAERRIRLSRQAVAMARRVGDPATLVHTLNAERVVLWGPENIEARLESATEIIRLAEETNDREMVLRGHIWRITDLVELGDLSAAEREIAVYTRQAEQLRHPFYLWFLVVWRAMRAGLEGRFAEAEQLAHQALAIGQRAQDLDGEQYFTGQIIAFRAGRGLKATELQTKELVERYRAIPAWRCVLALIYADSGLREEARREFEYFAAQDFANLPRDRDWLNIIANLAQVCAFLRDRPRAAMLYRLLLPYAEHCIVVGPAVLCVGSAARFLGLLTMTMGRWEEARSHFDTALQVNAGLGARPLVALTQHMYALMLLACGQPGDVERAADFLGQALTTARELGMSRLEERIQSAVQSLQSKVQGPRSKVQSAETGSQEPEDRILLSMTPDAGRRTPNP